MGSLLKMLSTRPLEGSAFEASWPAGDSWNSGKIPVKMPDTHKFVPGRVFWCNYQIIANATLTEENFCLKRCHVRKELCKNIIMSGGSTMYEGIADRLKAELTNRAPAGAEIRIVASADRKYAVWKGGSTLASLSTFHSSWVTAEDYESHGAASFAR